VRTWILWRGELMSESGRLVARRDHSEAFAATALRFLPLVFAFSITLMLVVF